jgi:hypothetical protein
MLGIELCDFGRECVWVRVSEGLVGCEQQVTAIAMPYGSMKGTKE